MMNPQICEQGTRSSASHVWVNALLKPFPASVAYTEVTMVASEHNMIAVANKTMPIITFARICIFSV
jgi:hypothetical protein